MAMADREGFQLSPQQRRLWRLQRAGGAYTSRCAIEVRGELDPRRLARALAAVVARHEILRTTFPELPPLRTPLQVIAGEAGLDWRQVDRTAAGAASGAGCNGGDGWDELGALPGEAPFDVGQGPPLRALLVRLAEQRHGLLLSLPALCADGRSLLNIAAELGRAYEGGALDAVPLQYADYAAWQDELLEGGAAAADATAPAAPPLPLPPLPPAPAVFAPGEVAEVWPAARRAEIEAAAGSLGVSPAAWLLAAWQGLLARLAGRAKVSVGVLCEGREYAELQGAVGLFARYVPVQAGGENPTFHGLAAALEAALAAARDGQDSATWEGSAGDAVPAAVGAGAFLACCFEHAELPPADHAAGIELEVTRLAVCLDRFELRLGCLAAAAGLRVALAFDPVRHDAAGAMRIAEQLGVLAGGAAASPGAPISALPLLSAAARHQLLFAWNDTAAPPATATVAVHDRFARQAALTPRAIALEHEERTLTYAELAARAAATARHLESLGVGPETVVGLLMARSPELVIALLAVLGAGGAYLPLDPELPSERLAFMVEDSGAALVLTAGVPAAALPSGAARVVRLDDLVSAAAAPPAPPGSPAPAAPAAMAEQLAYVIYTSGSTGRPKGTLISHRALANYLDWSLGALAGGGDGAPLHSPLAFDLSVTALFVPLLCGQRVTLVPESEGLDGLAGALRRDREYGFVKLTPAHMEVLRQQLGDGVAAVRCRALVLGGEALLAAHVAWWQERAPATRLLNEYGPTETTVGCCVHELRPADAGTEALPIGRPIAGMRLHVVDEDLEPVPIGVAGELVIGGAGLARGYLRRPALTAERFVPDPHGRVAGERLYRTGDRARYRPDGELEFLGRGDRQVKLHGYRIELGEIEALLRQHPAVREAAVLVDEEQAGQPRLCACWSGEQPGPGAAGLSAWLERQLAPAMVPRIYVGLESLPLTRHGKVDLEVLREIARRQGDVQRRPYRPPRTPAERILAEIWVELLPVERVGLDDNFFQLGGDSIVSLQLLGRASRRGLRLTTRQIFGHPSLVELAAVASTAAAAPSEPGLIIGPVPLLPIQHAFFATPDPAPHHYNLVLWLELLRPLAAAGMAAAVAALWRHHDALRLRFRRVAGAWTQENAGLAGPDPFAVLDLAALPAASRAAALAAAPASLATGFDLAAGPLARFVLIRCGEAGPPAGSRLLVLLHHLVTDTVSLRILREDLEQACREVAAGAPPALPAKTTSFRRWAERLRVYGDSGELRTELGTWLAAQRRAAVQLPLDGAPRRRTVASAATCRQALDAAATRALLREVPGAYRTEIGDVLLAALALVLTRWSGGPVLVDLEGHGREEIFAGLDVTRTVGWFTSLYPVLLDLPMDAGLRQTLIAVKEQLRRVPHRGVGYGALRYLCADGAVRQALAALPPPEVSFNYLGQLDAGGRSATAAGSWFGPAGGAAGAAQGRLRRRPHLLEINAYIASGRLQVEWRYDREAHRRPTIEDLAGRFLKRLGELIAHCRTPGTGAYTPSDFPLARLDQARLDELRAGYGEIADLYPLTAMQESMLLHTLSFPASDVGFEQTVLRLRGGVDAAALRRAWQRLADRHAVLRTCFALQGMEVPLQAVLPAVAPPWTEVDLTRLPPAGRERRCRELLAADRRRGFDLERAPLWRLLLVRLAAGESRLVWSRHHALLDGWSTAVVMGEMQALYLALCGGGEPELPPCRPYRDYIAWLAEQDPAQAAAYWRRLLAGVSAPTPLVVERSGSPCPAAARRWGGRRRDLPAALGAGLQQLAGRRRLTANLLLMGAWACLLSRYCGEPDVVFGSTVAGRPAGLAGVETMVGLFIKNLPVRVRCAPAAAVVDMLDELQRGQLELREHEAASPADVQPWSEVPGCLPLFESLLVFENYPVASGWQGPWDEAGEEQEEQDSDAAVRTAYPLTLVAAQARQLVLLLLYDRSRFEDTAARRMLQHLENLLGGMAEDPARPVGELPLLAAGERHQLLREWGQERPPGGPWLVLDERRQPVPVGVMGELCRATPAGLPLGTGEVACYREDGALVPLGRRDRLVRVQGRRADLRRLEEVLAEHPQVAAAAAVVQVAAGGGPRLLAFVEAAAGAAPAAGELRDFLCRRFSQAPQPAEFVVLASMPRQPGGAIDRDALPSPEAARLAATISEDLLGIAPDLVEVQLARLWEEVLGTRPIGPEDDFFALGGTSVAALRLASRIRRELGRDVPLAAFYGAATVRGLAARLRSAAGEPGWRPLVPIRPGGSRLPFFCVHPVGGNVLCFVELARRLDPRRPFYGLQAAGLGGGRGPHRRLAEMAAHYLEEIRSVQPAGPYLLGGLSFGGYVAFEMAQQLRARGEEVALLALLDTASPLYRGQRTFHADAAAMLAIQAGIIARAAGVELELDRGELRRLAGAAQVEAVVERLLATAGAVRDLGAEHLGRLLALFQGHALCLESYQPRRFPGRITVFRAREEHRALEAMLDHPAQHEPDYGWSELSVEAVVVRQVPGNHSSMVYEPQVAGLAAELDAALAAADPAPEPVPAAAAVLLPVA
jgi:amino acid adenylation domain-containing protein/non-ribosomal peptide synthase protein (TIGR01720 family)